MSANCGTSQLHCSVGASWDIGQIENKPTPKVSRKLLESRPNSKQVNYTLCWNFLNCRPHKAQVSEGSANQT